MSYFRMLPVVMGLLAGSYFEQGDPEPKTGAKRDDNAAKITFIWCPPGTFMMGSPKGEAARLLDEVADVLKNEEPTQVKLTQGFWLGRTPVTQSQWSAVMDTKPWAKLSRDEAPLGGDYPAVGIGWYDAKAFCDKLTSLERTAGRLPQGWSYALPTEAQWEYARRAGTTTAYSFGDNPKLLDDHGWYENNSYESTCRRLHPVALKKPNAWGLYDMQSLVWESCADQYRAKLPGGSDPLVTRGDADAAHEAHSVRGGTFRGSARYARSAHREQIGTRTFAGSGLEIYYGFRVALVHR
jgi:formylglycine-generating enzyme required for sulfatase activity